MSALRRRVVCDRLARAAVKRLQPQRARLLFLGQQASAIQREDAGQAVLCQQNRRGLLVCPASHPAARAQLTLTAWRGVAREGNNTWQTARSLPPKLTSDGGGGTERRGLLAAIDACGARFSRLSHEDTGACAAPWEPALRRGPAHRSASSGAAQKAWQWHAWRQHSAAPRAARQRRPMQLWLAYRRGCECCKA